MNRYVKSLVYSLLTCVLLLEAGAASSDAGTAVTIHGPREGRVIVREFEQRFVVTITAEKHLFQFYARDVEMVTATENVLVGVRTLLLSEPSEDAKPIINLSRGIEVIIKETPKDSEWIKVNAWGTNEGWIQKSILTDRVVFTPEERSEFVREPSISAEAIPEASAAIHTDDLLDADENPDTPDVSSEEIGSAT